MLPKDRDYLPDTEPGPNAVGNVGDNTAKGETAPKLRLGQMRPALFPTARSLPRLGGMMRRAGRLPDQRIVISTD
jgi:hypothetical protein